MKKIALFAFNGDPMCFIHVLINAVELKENGNDVALVIEGSATKLVKLLTGGSGIEYFKKNLNVPLINWKGVVPTVTDSINTLLK